MPSATARYFLSADRQTQCLVEMTDTLHRMIWGVATYSNVPHDGAEVVSPADPLEWLEGQMAVRLGAAAAAERIGKVRAAEEPLELRITPGIEKPYRLALVGGGDFITLSEHHTPRQACDARDEAKAAAADALIALRECAA